MAIVRLFKNNLNNFLIFVLVFVLLMGWLFSGWPRIWQNPTIPPETKEVKAAEVLTNGSFTGGTTGWTPTDIIYDGTNYQDSAGSIYLATDVGRNKSARGNCLHGASISTNESDTVTLSLYWKKAYASVLPDLQTLSVQIQSAGGDWSVPTTIWTHTDFGAWDWTYVSVDVSSYFSTGNYDYRYFMDLNNPNNASAQTEGWFDNTSLDVTSTNQDPIVDSVSIDPTPDIDLNADGQKTVTITATITDNDGCEEVFTDGSITGVFYDADTVADSCSANDNNCYPSLILTEVGNTCDGASDYTGDASITVDVWFHANPGSNWTAKVTAVDGSAASGSNTSTVIINTLIAFKLDTSTIDYQTVNPDNVSSQQTVLITTTGNVAIDVNLSGTDMTWSGNTIDVGQQKYSDTNGFDWDSAGTALSGSAVRHELSTTKPTANPSNQSETVYWKLKVPSGKAAGGPYSGTNTLSVVAD